MEQPKIGDGEQAWRQYAGHLRQALGEAQRLADPVIAEAKIAADVAAMRTEVGLARTRIANAREAADRRVRAANEVAERRRQDRQRTARRRDVAERALVAVYWSLRRGDVPRAFEVIERALPPKMKRRTTDTPSGARP